MKKALSIFFLSALFLGLSCFLIYDDMLYLNQNVFNEKWHLGDAKEPFLDEILAQTFTYVGEGGQAIAFQSEDQRYILKLFKFRRLTPSFFIRNLPSIYPFREFKKKHIQRREKKLETAFLGHKIAFLHHKKESGLIHVQLNAEPKLKDIHVIDRHGFKRGVSLKNCSFVLQEKGKILSDVFKELFSKNDLINIKGLIDQLFDLYLSEYKKGIYDQDRGIMHNLGCVGQKIIHLDVGCFVENQKMKDVEFFEKDLSKIGRKINQWVQKNYPEHFGEISEWVDIKLSTALDKGHA